MNTRKTLSQGDFHHDVLDLRKFLLLDGLSDGVAKLEILNDMMRIGKGSFDKELYLDVVDFQARHVDSNGFFLDVDGDVGSNTWWALENQTSSSQRSFIDLYSPNRLPDYRMDFLEIAITEYMKNVVEVPEGSNKGFRIDEYTRYTPNPWCAFYASWVIMEFKRNNIMVPVVDISKRMPEGSTYSIFRHTKTNQSFYSKDDIVIRGRKVIPGDLFIMQYRDKNGNLLGRGHIGIVLNFEYRDNKWMMNTLEGNTGNRLKLGYREFKKNDSIEGFINLFGDKNKPNIGNFDSKVMLVGSKTDMDSTR